MVTGLRDNLSLVGDCWRLEQGGKRAAFIGHQLSLVLFFVGKNGRKCGNLDR